VDCERKRPAPFRSPPPPSRSAAQVGSGAGDLIADLAVAAPLCTPASEETLWETDCGPGPVAATVFVVAFCALSRLIVIPFITATLVSSYVSTIDDLRSMIYPDDMRIFLDTWLALDPHKTGAPPPRPAPVLSPTAPRDAKSAGRR
jgi:hypothetical protein